MGDRGQGGGWKVPTGLLQLFQRGAPICPPSHLFSDPFSLEALPPQELEDPQMSYRHRETCINYFLTWRISLFTRCFQWWSRALSGSEIPSCQSRIQSYPVLNEQVKDRIQSRLCYWVRWQVMSPFLLGRRLASPPAVIQELWWSWAGSSAPLGAAVFIEVRWDMKWQTVPHISNK